MSRMRACLDRKEREEIHPLASRGISGQLDGAASDENRFVLVPRDVWERVQPAINVSIRPFGISRKDGWIRHAKRKAKPPLRRHASLLRGVTHESYARLP